jgi:hypothetical protein
MTSAERPRIVLVHWSKAGTPERIGRLRAAGYDVDGVSEMTPQVLKRMKDSPPRAFVIDLSHLPSHGRRVGEVAREQRSLCDVPLVFVGDRDNIARVRQTLPDAVFTSWRGIRGALAGAIARRRPLSPGALRRIEGYSGTPLSQKLGIKPHGVVAILGAPDGFVDVLAPLPDGVDLRRDLTRPPDLALFFVRERQALEHAMSKILSVLEFRGGAWVAWPKRSSGVATDVTENVIREIALPRGLVDIKVCAIDAVWSGLRLARRQRV